MPFCPLKALNVQNGSFSLATLPELGLKPVGMRIYYHLLEKTVFYGIIAP